MNAPHTRLIVLPVLAIVLAVTGCGPTEPAEPASNPDTPSVAASTPTAPAEPPTITVTDKTDTQDDTWPVDISVQVPVLSGVSDEIAQQFSDAFNQALQDQITAAAKAGVQVQPPSSDPMCSWRPVRDGKATIGLNGQTTAAVYENYVTATTVWTINTCNYGNDFATSITMDWATGQATDITALLDPATGYYQQQVHDLTLAQCDSVFTAPLMGNVEAWSPTPDGLLLSWGDRYVTPHACRSIQITIPWPSSSQDIVPAGCPASAGLPTGIDPHVCGAMPPEVVHLTEERYFPGVGIFTTPLQDIACDLSTTDNPTDDVTQIECLVLHYSFTMPTIPPDLSGNAADYWAGNLAYIQGGEAQMGGDIDVSGSTEALNGHEPITTLEYGQAAGAGTVACISQEIGLSCWDVTTKHGFFLSEAAYHVW